MLSKLKKLFSSKSDAVEFTCSCCGKVHEEWPALAYDSPDHYALLSDEDKENIAELTSDFCMIKYPDETDRFIRGVLFQKVNDYNENLDYGIWVSLSEKSFLDYKEHFNDNEYNATYFGWICNTLEGHDYTLSIPANVCLKGDGKRPEIIPHQNHEHPFVYEYYNGIIKAEAEKRIHSMLEKVNDHK